MRKLFIILMLGASSCSANQMLQAAPVIGRVCTAAQRTLIDEKVVYAAQVLYNIPAQAYVSADRNHRLTPELKATLKPLLIRLNALRNTIKAARGSVNCDFERMKQLQVQIIQLLPR